MAVFSASSSRAFPSGLRLSGSVRSSTQSVDVDLIAVHVADAHIVKGTALGEALQKSDRIRSAFSDDDKRSHADLKRHVIASLGSLN